MSRLSAGSCAQTPPLVDKSPFHRFGVRLNTKAETVRDRRISREEEKRLLDAALAMNTWEHRYAGSLMHDRIIGALELCCRLDRSTGTGTTCVTKAPPASWETASTFAVQQTQRYVNVTDEELRKGLEVRTRTFEKWRALQDSNLWPSAPEADALSS